MRKPYRVIVWGPGVLGTALLKILHDRPEFEVVGVLCNSQSKVGLDAGEYIGRAATGVKMTSDLKAMLALQADVVLYSAGVAFQNTTMDRDIIALLESGKNVISASGYHYPPTLGPEYVAKLEEACRKGGTSIHGSGEIPGFFIDRVVPMLTSLCMDVEHIKLEEWFNVSQASFPMMMMFGMNRSLAEAQEAAPNLEPGFAEAYAESLTLLSQSIFGVHPKISVKSQYRAAKEDVVLPTATIKAGLVDGFSMTYTASFEGRTLITVVVYWDFVCSERWVVEIEGKPTSIRADITAFASLKGPREFRDNDTTRTGYYATAIPMILAIPVVCEAEPGIVYASAFTSAVPDIRSLGVRKSIVD